jgi:hypothetical protein
VAISINELKLRESVPRLNSTPDQKAPHPKQGRRFLRGPIPLDWINAATRASGRGSGLQVALALWYLSGLNRQARTVKLRGSVLRAMGLDRHAGYRGLKALENANLIEVERRPGRCPVVTLLDIEEPL